MKRMIISKLLINVYYSLFINLIFFNWRQNDGMQSARILAHRLHSHSVKLGATEISAAGHQFLKRFDET